MLNDDDDDDDDDLMMMMMMLMMLMMMMMMTLERLDLLTTPTWDENEPLCKKQKVVTKRKYGLIGYEEQHDFCWRRPKSGLKPGLESGPQMK